MRSNRTGLTRPLRDGNRIAETTLELVSNCLEIHSAYYFFTLTRTLRVSQFDSRKVLHLWKFPSTADIYLYNPLVVLSRC
jgi:hypothetical protein